MPALLPIFKKAYWSLAALTAAYAGALLLLTNPWLQRHALYAHRLHSGFYHDLDKPETFGFAQNQVTPFELLTPDGEKLYAWHVLPLNVYAERQHELEKYDPSGKEAVDVRKRVLDLLSSDASARVVVNFHGNAGHIAQGWRTDTYRSLSALPNAHVLTIDYRGFGHSTGTPTERGLITDGVALVSWILHEARIDPSRIVILGQSLGTAVASAVALHYADEKNTLLPVLPMREVEADFTQQSPINAVADVRTREGATAFPSTLFAGIVLVAPFTSLPNLLLRYRAGGVLPLLAPLRPSPYLQALVTSAVVDTWPSALRLAAYVSAATDHPDLLASEREGGAAESSSGAGDMGGGSSSRGNRGSVQIVHARNDADIPFEQGVALWAAALNVTGSVETVAKANVAKVDVKVQGKPRVGLRVLEFGGHNRVVTYAPVALAVLRAFGNPDKV